MSSAATPNIASASVEPNGAPPVAAPAADKPAVAAATAPPEFQKQLDDLRAELGEKDQAIKFWADKAKGEKSAPAVPAADPDDDTDLLELITTKGTKGLDAYLAKKGFVKADEVDKRVNAKASALTKEQELLKQYPDLSDKKSEFFKTTAEFYGPLIKAGTSPDVAMEMAAARTELEFMRAGKIKTPAQQTEDREKERRARIKAQGGERGGRAAVAPDDDDDGLTPEQLSVIRGMGITEEAYKARAKKGVAVKGIR